MNQTLNVSEVARLLQMSKGSVYKYAETGKIQSVKIGANLRFTEVQIQNFLEKNVRLFNPKTRKVG